MKILLLILLPIFGFSQKIQPKIAVDYFVGGYHYRVDNPMSNTVFSIDHGNCRARIGAEFSYKQASVYFDQHVYMKNSGLSFDPTQAYWWVGASYFWRQIKIKYEHECIHPINTYSGQYRSKYYGGYDMVSISYGY